MDNMPMRIAGKARADGARRSRRLDCVYEATVVTDGAERVDAVVDDISDGGMKLRSRMPLVKGSVVSVVIRMDDVHNCIKVMVRINRISKRAVSGEDLFEMGTEFVMAELFDIDRLRKFIF